MCYKDIDSPVFQFCLKYCWQQSRTWKKKSLLCRTSLELQTRFVMLGSMFDEILCARMVMTFVGHFGHTFRSTFLNFFIYFDSRTSLKNSIGHQFFWPRGFLHLECKFLGTLFFDYFESFFESRLGLLSQFSNSFRCPQNELLSL